MWHPFAHPQLVHICWHKSRANQRELPLTGRQTIHFWPHNSGEKPQNYLFDILTTYRGNTL
jgi:hypothetical protein